MKKYARYIITMMIGAVITFLICICKNLFHETVMLNKITILSDAFFTSGVLLAGFGLILVILDAGNFDILLYGCKILKNAFRKKENQKEIEKTFYDYRVIRETKKHSTSYLLITGIFYLLISALFTFQFYQI